MKTRIPKHSCTLVLSLFVLTAASGHLNGQDQQYKSFTLVQRELIWQQVFDSALSDHDCLAFFELLPTTTNPRSSGDYLLFDVNNLRVDYLKYGKTLANTPSVISDYAVSGKLKIERKEDKYRVTFYGIQLSPIVLNNSLLQRADFAYHVLKDKRDKIRPSCAREEVLGLYHQFFFDYFQVSNAIVQKDDW